MIHDGGRGSIPRRGKALGQKAAAEAACGHQQPGKQHHKPLAAKGTCCDTLQACAEDRRPAIENTPSATPYHPGNRAQFSRASCWWRRAGCCREEAKATNEDNHSSTQMPVVFFRPAVRTGQEEAQEEEEPDEDHREDNTGESEESSQHSQHSTSSP